jgi:glutamate-ammonia-ligase adenylyltransferase
VSTPEALGRALAGAPDPEMARVALSRIGESPEARAILADPVVVEHAAPLLGYASGATDFLVARPEETTLFVDLAPRPREALLAEASALLARLGPEAGFRRFRRRAMYRVAARDLAGASVDGVVAEVSAIAEVLLELATAEAGGGLTVIGMGKLGGSELNYVSDVDVIFVHAEGGADAQAEAARRASRAAALLSAPTEEGVAFRVDADLRPEGRSGPLSRSMAATVEYYRRHAATWERQAWLKARPVAGDLETGAALLAELEPVIYPDHLEPGAIEDVRIMKVRLEEYVRASGKDATSVKRGRGGIRDVEFAVQLLQLVHGRRDRALRRTNTLATLAAMGERGYVAEADAATLADSYRFLRMLEHRLQLVREVQTYDLPDDAAARRRIARSMDLGDAGDLEREHARHTEVVRGLHERLFYRPLLEAFAGSSTAVGTERPATEELLGALGFTDPSAAARRIERLVDPGTRAGRVLQHLFPVLAPALTLAAAPDAALVRFERVVESLPDAAADALASDPAAAVRLARTVAASSWAADAMSAAPELVGRLAAGEVPDAPAERLLEVAARYAAGELRVPDSGGAISEVADAVVREALAEAGPEVPFAVIGLGKLGAEELNFASDVDVMFVYEGEGADAFAAAGQAAERTLAGIRARGFEADADLRPEGRSGPLARSMAAYLEYWEGHAETWEFQALLKARAVAGDEMLGKRFTMAAEDFAFPESLPLDAVAAIRRMRVRMEEERVKPPDARRFHFKLGHGGLADVQFAVELSQLRFGSRYPETRKRHTMDALEALARERLIEDGVSLALGEAYVFLNEVKNALEIDRRVHAEAIPPTAEEQLALARRLGYEEYPRASFLEDYRRITRRARAAMERVFYGDEPE